MSLQEYLFTGSSKATSCGLWQKRVRLSDLLEGGLTVLQEHTLRVLLVLPNIPSENTEFGRRRPCVRCCIAIRIARLVFVGVVFVPRGTAEWLTRVDCVRRTPAIGDWRFCQSKTGVFLSGVALANQPKKGPKRKVHEYRPFLCILVFFLRKTSTIHIEFLFRNALVKSS